MDFPVRRAVAGAATLLLLLPAAAAAQSHDPGKPLFDSRTREPVRAEAPEDPGAIRARDRLSARLGRQGVLDVDARTGTPRMVAKLDGFLTGASGDDPARIALDYVRAQRGVFSLSDADLDGLRLVRRYRDAGGTTYLLWAQTWRGLVAWDNDLRAAVSADGRLINVSGSPVGGIASRTAVPDLTAAAALSEALDDVGSPRLSPKATPRGGPDRRTTFTGGHEARLVLFTERAGDVHLAWNVTANAGPAEIYTELIDAHSGKLLFRTNRVDHVAGQVRAFERNPGDGTESLRAVDVTNQSRLAGPNAHVFANVDGDNVIDASEEVPANIVGPPHVWNDAFADKCGGGSCSWNRTVPNSWQDNLPHDAQQVYWLVNNFHDHLARSQIGFRGFEGVDLVNAAVLDGANTDAGLPDANHRNNATMSTPPEGQAPTMRMFLFTSPDRSAGHDATVVYHEYTHGLSNRLITRANGEGALDAHQAASMGEGWSDWYALDKLAADTPSLDTATPGQMIVGEYATGNPTGVRFKALDCPVGVTASRCGSGGFTYGDLGTIASNGPQVHADGEIWAETLWDLRDALGSDLSQRLVTGGMRLSPDDPSMLEMRNAILLADQTDNAGANRTAIWQVFARRGMGYFAFSSGAADTKPRESFATPPPPGSGGTVSGRVTEQRTGRPVPGGLVQLASSASGFPGDLVATTDANGNYAIPDAPAGTYPLVVVDAPGHSPAFQSDVTVGPGGRTLDAVVLRNWASSPGGSVKAFDGPDFGPGFGSACGPDRLIDRNYANVWASTSPTSTYDAGGAVVTGAKSITLQLPQAVDVDGFSIDPGAGCGDDDTASTASFRIETSTDGQSFLPVANGAFTSADNHRPNVVMPTQRAAAVSFVRYTMLTPQRQLAGDSGVQFMDTAEFEVFGVPAVGQPPPATGPPPADPPAAAAVQPGVALPPVDRAPPAARLGVTAGQRLRTVLARGLKITVACNEPCSARLTARLDAKTAKRVGLLSRRSRAKSANVGAGTLRMGQGPRTATLRLTRKARTRLKRLREVKLAVAAVVTDRSGNSGKASRRVALRR